MSSEVHRYKLGDIAVTVLVRRLPHCVARRLHPRMPAKTSSSPRSPTRGSRPTTCSNVYAPVLIETGGKRVLIDTGNGEAVFAQSKGERGRLQHNLAAAGIDRNAIDRRGDFAFPRRPRERPARRPTTSAAFPNAEIMVPEPEWIFWMDDGEMSRASPRPHDASCSTTTAVSSTRSAARSRATPGTPRWRPASPLSARLATASATPRSWWLPAAATCWSRAT